MLSGPGKGIQVSHGLLICYKTQRIEAECSFTAKGRRQTYLAGFDRNRTRSSGRMEGGEFARTIPCGCKKLKQPGSLCHNFGRPGLELYESLPGAAERVCHKWVVDLLSGRVKSRSVQAAVYLLASTVAIE